MKTFSATALLALLSASTISALPAVKREAGPSGMLNAPKGGASYDANTGRIDLDYDIVDLDYTKTKSINVFLVGEDSDYNHTLATNVGIPDGRSNALGTYRVPNDRPEGLTDYRVQIIETQIVPGTSYLYVDPFVAAAPAVTITGTTPSLDVPVHTPAGPSGNVISPSGGSIYNIRNSLIQFTYNETFTEEIETRDVAVYLIRESTDLNVTLGTDMNAVYDQWWHLPAYLEAADDYMLQVIETQYVRNDEGNYNKLFTPPFIAASPFLTLTA